MSDSSIQLVHSAGEARVDSRVIAEEIGVKHKNTLALIEKHAKHFERFGVVPFQTDKPRKGTAGGRPEKHAPGNGQGVPLGYAWIGGPKWGWRSVVRHGAVLQRVRS